MHWVVVKPDGSHAGLWPKVVLPMFTSPIIGFIVALYGLAWWLISRGTGLRH